MTFSRTVVSVLTLVTLVTLATYSQMGPQGKNSFNGFDLVDKAGNIAKPKDYRDKYQALRTYTVLDPKGDQKDLTYASPGAAEYYRNKKKVADGAVLGTEGDGTGHGQETDGVAH